MIIRSARSSSCKKNFFLIGCFVACTCVRQVVSWIPQSHVGVRKAIPSTTSSSVATSTSLFESNEEDSEQVDLSGKTIYQRTFYRLSPGSKVTIPNAMVIEERVRFVGDPNNPGYLLPSGPRTLLLREGTAEDEITKVLYHFDVGSKTHDGPGRMEPTIATILFLVANPQLLQGDVLQLSCESGVAGLLGCIGAKFTSSSTSSEALESVSPQNQVLTVPEGSTESMFPPQLHQLTLSEEDESLLDATYENVRRSHLSSSEVSLKQLKWSISRMNRSGGRPAGGFRTDKVYRTIIGSNIEFSYPSAKELARTIAYSLLPSNPMAIATSERYMSSSSSSESFGGLGMDLEDTATAPESSSDKQKEKSKVDPNIPPVFLHVCPDYGMASDNMPYLRQFLEKGCRMTVDNGYLKLERLQFGNQIVDSGTAEDVLDDMDLELLSEGSSVYQSLTAIHHTDYPGDGAGEYFFPLETGAYEGGRSSSLEPEAEGGASPF